LRLGLAIACVAAAVRARHLFQSSQKVTCMIRAHSSRQTAVPQIWQARLEILRAVETLREQCQDDHMRRRVEIAGLRRDCGLLAQTLRDVSREWERLTKAYDPDEPRIPKYHPGGGRWTSEDEANTDVTEPRIHYAQYYPPPLPGYDPNTWKQGQWPNTGALWVEDPDGRRYLAHPEDGGHWRHWDDDNNNRIPPNSKKPWPGQKKLKEDQSWSDPNGDAPPWEPTDDPTRNTDPFVPVVPIDPTPLIIPSPIPTFPPVFVPG